MTAINILAQRDAGHIICDGAGYNAAGTLLRIGPKCVALPQIPALIASRGPCEALPIVQYHVSWKFRTYDALLGGIAETLQEIVDVYGDFFEAGGFPEIQLFMIGYSETRKRFAAFAINTHDVADAQAHVTEQVGGIDMDRVTFPKPYELSEMEAAFICPFLPADQIEAISRGRTDVDQLDPIADGLAMLEAQRQMKMSFHPGAPLAHHVGGFAMVSTVTREGVTQRIVHRWEEDTIGEPIRPAAPKPLVGSPIAPPAGMSKLQRDMWARKQRKAARR